MCTYVELLGHSKQNLKLSVIVSKESLLKWAEKKYDMILGNVKLFYAVFLMVLFVFSVVYDFHDLFWFLDAAPVSTLPFR